MTPKSAFKESTGVTRATFNYVRDNPGQTRIQTIDGLAAQGYPSNSTSSLLAQMAKQGLIRSVEGLLFVNQQEYTPLKSPTAFAKSLLPKAAKQKRAKSVPPAKAPVVIETPPAVPVKTKKDWSPDDVIEGLNVKQAMAVYDALHKIFRL